eukprot:GHVH01014605.1.p1 GENE.GHVH01014605.1~~GHVH01014605.1.p1  ORF type:complete len:189 (+),score=28.34 GHVH01014605.1:40-606(+)
MKSVKVEGHLEVPEGVTVTVCKRIVTCTGKYGTVTKNFQHIPCEIHLVDNVIRLTIWHADQWTRACINTIITHIRNAIVGVTKNFVYKMRLVYNHFPINANIIDNGSALEVRNFMGQKRTRILKMREGCVVEKSKDIKDELIFTGPDVEAVAGSCASVNRSCKVKKKDIRKFLDGVYVSFKGTLEVDA